MEGLNNRNLFSHSFWRLKVKIKGPAELDSGEACLPGLQRATILLCPQMAFSLCAHGKRLISGFSSFSYKDKQPYPGDLNVL
jgi:hypothetical protein